MSEFVITAAILWGAYKWGNPSKKESAMKMGDYTIKEFSGNKLHWTKWKEDSLAAFVATGYDKVLKSSYYAQRHKIDVI